MKRTPKNTAQNQPAIDLSPTAIYRPEQIRAALGLRASSLRTEWRRGRLRVVRRCGKNYLLGRDLLKWLDGGELASPQKKSEQAAYGPAAAIAARSPSQG